MDINCCACGQEQPLIKALEAEEERKQAEYKWNISVPTIGIICENCLIDFKESQNNAQN